jgi:fructose PTS system EIIBC or EIIC component
MNPLLTLAVVLVAGVVSGLLARRAGLPAVTGQILVGVVHGPVTGLFGHDVARAMQPVTVFALGLMAVAVGGHLHVRRLRNAKKRLGLLVLCEATITPALVFGAVLTVPGTPWVLALLLATLAVSTAPATLLAVAKEGRAKGVFVKTLLAGVALDNIAAIALFELAHVIGQATLDPTLGHTALDVALRPFRTVLLSALLGVVVGGLLVLVTRRVVRSDRVATLSMIAILGTVGVATEVPAISALLACLFLGVALANLTPEREEIGHKVFENFEGAIFAVFFTLAGMELDFGFLAKGGLLALAVFAARIVAKLLAASLAMRWAGAPRALRRWLGVALVPQAGLAVGLMLLVTDDPVFGSLARLFLAVVLTLVTLNELVGPPLTRWALARSGELGMDRARLIDFLHEQNITTDLRADTLDEAIERLVDLLIASHELVVDRGKLLASVREREAQASTMLGEGLAIPHAELEAGDQIVGVMGISREGLPFDTPDGVPIHCIILLATPPTQRTRHLEVLAAFARAIGVDRAVRQRLFHARSPAHAYHLLHAGEAAAGFNVFLEEE